MREMQSPEGGYYSTLDADSEGEEGKFYVWTQEELESLLGDDFFVVAAVFGVTAGGNFEGANVLHRPAPLAATAKRFAMEEAEVAALVTQAKQRLLEVRAERVPPAIDDKIVTAWNGLALRAFAEAAAVLGNERYLAAATRLARFATTELRDERGRLVRTWRRGVRGPAAFCDDYAALAVGLFTLYQATGEAEWWNHGRRLVEEAIQLFGAPDGGFFATGTDAVALITRPMNLTDNPTPSDNSLMAEALQMLAAYTGDTSLAAHLQGVYRAAGRIIEQAPAAVGHLLAVALSGFDGPKEVAIVGEAAVRRSLEAVIWERFRPDCVMAAADEPHPLVPLLVNRTAPEGSARAYVCRNFVCELPISDPPTLRTALAPTPPEKS